MARAPSRIIARIATTIDISCFTNGPTHPSSNERRNEIGKSLVEALHSFGFVKIVGHGVPEHDIDEALSWTKRLFDLPFEEKMKAPHPIEPMPHRGYSSVGREKVYSQEDVMGHKHSENVTQSLRKISDFKVRVISQPRTVTSFLCKLIRC